MGGIKIYVLFFFCVFALVASPHELFAKVENEEIATSHPSKLERYIQHVYKQIKFPKGNKLRFSVFENGLKGFLNMKDAGKLNNSNLLSICDFTLSSNKKRLWVIDMGTKKVLFHCLVAHGMGSGEEFATSFSNIENSHQSSLGFYTTAETYTGNNGYSLKLQGQDGSFNSLAYERAIVIHAADYVSKEFADANERIGRSHGCPALPVELAPKIIDKIKNGSCFFIYHTANNYLSASYWLKRRLKHLPEEAEWLTSAIQEKFNSEADSCQSLSTPNEVFSANKEFMQHGDKVIIPTEAQKKEISEIVIIEQTKVPRGESWMAK